MDVEKFIRQLEKIYMEQDYQATLDFIGLHADEMLEKMNQQQRNYAFDEIGESCLMLKHAVDYEKALAEGRDIIYDIPPEQIAPAANEPE